MDLLANYNSSEDEQEEVKAPRIRKSYTAEFKLNVVKFARENNNHKAATKFGVDVSSVRDWKKQETSLHVIKNSSPAGKFKKKLPGSGRPLTYKDLDEQLAFWVRERRSKKLRIPHAILQQRAIQTFNSEKDEEGFKQLQQQVRSRGHYQANQSDHLLLFGCKWMICPSTLD
uniref:Brinker DNA-binding domain-containing protein n=1 Tax=Ditylenchus dipsaci TaxID=166011 RepID=A0A915EWJ2_9BILA